MIAKQWLMHILDTIQPTLSLLNHTLVRYKYLIFYLFVRKPFSSSFGSQILRHVFRSLQSIKSIDVSKLASCKEYTSLLSKFLKLTSGQIIYQNSLIIGITKLVIFLHFRNITSFMINEINRSASICVCIVHLAQYLLLG
jgi:hypothetical protein